MGKISKIIEDATERGLSEEKIITLIDLYLHVIAFTMQQELVSLNLNHYHDEYYRTAINFQMSNESELRDAECYAKERIDIHDLIDEQASMLMKRSRMKLTPEIIDQTYMNRLIVDTEFDVLQSIWFMDDSITLPDLRSRVHNTLISDSIVAEHQLDVSMLEESITNFLFSIINEIE